MRKVRWVKAQLIETITKQGKEDEVLFEGDGLILARISGPGLIITAGEYRLTLIGEDIFANLENAIKYARIDHANNSGY